MRFGPTRLVVLGVLAVSLSQAALAEGAPSGEYECWFYSTPHPLQNFTLDGDAYVDASGKSGSVTVSGDEIHFSGASLDGRTGIYRGDPPSISFVNADGEVILLCQLAR
jgi:hypothetical protein